MLDRIFADFNNCDPLGRVRLNSDGTLADLKEKKITLKRGQKFLLNDDDGLSTIGEIVFSANEKIWVAKIDWDTFQVDNRQ
ncbi:MAG: hypothetical protein AAF587_20050 [Bacteroidota bacterium]